jgi:hypothetical protein
MHLAQRYLGLPIVLLFLALAATSVASSQVTKALPACRVGYAYALIDHKFTCIPTCKTGYASEFVNGKPECVSNDDRLDSLEQTADSLVPRLKVRIALCKSCQIWAEIDNEHVDAQEVRRRLEDDTGKLALKLDVVLYVAESAQVAKLSLTQGQEIRFLEITNEVNGLLAEHNKQLRRCLAAQ